MDQGKDGEEEMEGKQPDQVASEQGEKNPDVGDAVDQQVDSGISSSNAQLPLPDTSAHDRLPIPTPEEKTSSSDGANFSGRSRFCNLENNSIVQSSNNDSLVSKPCVNSKNICKTKSDDEGTSERTPQCDSDDKSSANTENRQEQLTNTSLKLGSVVSAGDDDKNETSDEGLRKTCDSANAGTEGATEDDESKSKRLLQKRRINDTPGLSAPAPKIKRMRKPGADSTKKDQKDDYYQKVQKQKDQKKGKEKSRDDDKKDKAEGKGKKKSRDSSEEDSSDEEGDSVKKKQRRRSGGLSAMPKVKNLRRNIRDIMSDDKLEEDTLAAQKEEQLRLQRLQEKRAALREYMEQQEVKKFLYS